MATSAEERNFLSRIRAYPRDDGPRLIYADWLDDRGDPRGEFVRLQCALARIPSGDPARAELAAREQQLLQAHESEWAGPVPELVSGWKFRRGVLESVSLSVEGFLEHGRRLFRIAPIRAVRLTDLDGHFQKLIDSPVLRAVRELDLCGNDLGNGGVNLLTRSANAGGLESLDLSFNGISDTGVRLIAAAGNVPNLRTLLLNDNGPIGRHGTAGLASGAAAGRLLILDLSACGLDADAIRGLVGGPGLAGLRALHLHANRIGDDGVGPLALSELYRRLVGRCRRIDLRANDIEARGASRLARAGVTALAERIDLAGNLLKDQGVRDLTNLGEFDRLRELRLADNQIGARGAVHLAKWETLARLTHLDLRDNPLTRTGIAALRRSPHLDWRATLDLPEDTELMPTSSRRIDSLEQEPRQPS